MGALRKVTEIVGEITRVRVHPTAQRQVSRPVLTRAELAHWRMTWPQRLARNARSSTASSLSLLLHGLSASFAHRYGFAFLDAT